MIAEQNDYSTRNMSYVELPVDDVQPSPLNPRKTFAEDGLRELAESIREHGILEPLVVRCVILPPVPGSLVGLSRMGYELVAGERRLRAAKMAGLAKVPVHILGEVDDKTALSMMLVENLQRRDLDPIEEAAGYAALRELGYTQAAIAEKVNRSQPAVANSLRLLELPPAVKADVSAGKMSASHARALAGYSRFPKLVAALAELATKDGTPVRDLERGILPNWEWRLEEQNLIKRMGYGCEFDWKTVCAECEHGAFRKAVHAEAGYCLKPGCFDSKTNAARLTKKLAAKKAVQAALAAAGGQILDLEKLPSDGYREVTKWEPLPAGCEHKEGRTCDKMRQGRTPAYAVPVDVCTDVACWNRLKDAAQKAERKRQRAEKAARLASLAAKMESVTGLGSGDMAIIATYALEGISVEHVRAAIAAHVPAPVPWAPADPTGSNSRDSQYMLWALLPPLTLAKVVIEALVRHDLSRHYDTGWSECKRAEWYLGIDGKESAR